MGLYLKKVLENKAEIAVWQITESEEELKALSSTPSDEMEEISWIKSESLRKQRLAVRALLNELFDEKVYLSHHDNGKPFLENRVTNISITHTDKYVAVILHESEDVGIDIESLDRDFSAVELKAFQLFRSARMISGSRFLTTPAPLLTASDFRQTKKPAYHTQIAQYTGHSGYSLRHWYS